MERFPGTLVDARTVQLRHQQHQTHIASDLVTNEPAFHMHIPIKAFIHEDPEAPTDDMLITLVNTGIAPIDIPVHTLLAYTNHTDRRQACALLEIAIASSAVQMLVVYNEYWKNATHSELRGIPIIDTETLLRCVVPALVGEQTCFPTPNMLQYEDINYNIQIQIDPVLYCTLCFERSQLTKYVFGPGTRLCLNRSGATHSRFCSHFQGYRVGARLQTPVQPYRRRRHGNPALLGGIL